MIAEIARWIEAGADLTDGLRLFSKYGGSPAFGRLLRLDPERFRQPLYNELVRIGGIDPALAQTQRRFFTPVRSSMRREWPFLSRADCPPELKILAADKITAYHRYVELHNELFDCSDLQQCYRTASGLLSAFIENREIHQEFEYYHRHGHPLGRHPVFESFRRMRELQSKSVLELVDLQKRLKHNLWRIRSEIDKGDRPDLRPERERQEALKKHELQQVENLLEQYR